jgi:hypothetical protein
MENSPKKHHWLNLSDDAKRQYIDAQSVFTALEEAQNEAVQVRGGMHWKKQNGNDYLIRSSAKNSQKSLGRRSEETIAIFEKFIARKARVEQRVKNLKTELVRHQRMNNALHVGRAPQILVDILNRLEVSGLSEHFSVVGTHSLYAYESTAGVRFAMADALATNDIDLLWDTRKRVSFIAHMDFLGSSMINLLRKVDPTFALREFQRYTAVNDKGFEVDIIRREAKDLDPHPLRLTDAEDEFAAVQAPKAEILLNSPKFSSMIISTSGHMARMNTIAPKAFIDFKRWMGERPDRDPLKKSRDILQADLVEELVREYLPHLG